MAKKEQAVRYYPAKYKTKIEAVLDMLKGGQTIKQIKSRMLVSDSYIYLARKQLKEAAGVLELIKEQEVPDQMELFGKEASNALLHSISQGKGRGPDLVNSPAHYTYGGIETIDFIRAKLTNEEFTGYLKGNVIKYLTRADLKGNPAQDLAKAKWYMDRLA
jgi:hypothetical protein